MNSRCDLGLTTLPSRMVRSGGAGPALGLSRGDALVGAEARARALAAHEPDQPAPVVDHGDAAYAGARHPGRDLVARGRPRHHPALEAAEPVDRRRVVTVRGLPKV